MKSLRSILLVAVMGTVAYGLYVSLTKNPGPSLDDADPPPSWQAGAGGDSAPAFSQAQYGAVPPTTLLPEQDSMPPLASVDPQSAVGRSNDAPGTLPDMAATERPLPDSPKAATYEAPMASAVASSNPGGNTRQDVAQSRYEGIDDDGFAEAHIASSDPVSAAANSGSAAADPADAKLHELFQTAISAAQQLIEQGQLLEALEGLSAWYAHDKLLPEEHAILNKTLDSLAGEVVYNYTVHSMSRAHNVTAGETLETIAAQYQIPAELVGKINGIAPGSQLAPGTSLKVVPGPFSVDIDLTTHTLTLFLQDNIYAGRFPIGLGKELPPAEGDYTVTTKIPNPPYYDQFAAGDPQNPLGSRWIGLGEKCGIHGTNNPQTLGSLGEEGSIRMLTSDVEDLYDILTVQTSKVTVHR